MKQRTPKFYMLPKIHKKDNPGRPIISAMDSHTENISAFGDFHLRPLVMASRSYLQDTTHLLNTLGQLGQVPPNSLLVTTDVSSLYTSTPHLYYIFHLTKMFELSSHLDHNDTRFIVSRLSRRRAGNLVLPSIRPSVCPSLLVLKFF